MAGDQSLNPTLAPNFWNTHADSSSTKDKSSAGLIIETPHGEMYEHALKFMFKASINQVGYEAQIAEIKLCDVAGAKSVKVYSTS